MQKLRVLHWREWSGQVSEWVEFNAPPDTIKVISEAEVVWANSQFDVLKFIFFIGLFNATTGRIFGRNATHSMSLYVVLSKVDSFGLHKMKFEILSPLRLLPKM